MATKLKNFSTTAASNNSTPPDGFPEGMDPATVNNSARELMARLAEWYQDPQWINLHTPTYVSTTQFSVTGDQTAYYTAGRRVKAVGTTPFTIYGTISTSAYSSVTTVTVLWDSGSLNNTLTTVEVGILTSSSSSDVVPLINYNAQTGTTYTLAASDNGKVVTVENASAITVTVPQQSSVTLSQGFHCVVRQKGAGQITLATQGSDVLRAPNGSKTRTQYSDIFIDLQDAGSPNTWHAIGDTTT